MRQILLCNVYVAICILVDSDAVDRRRLLHAYAISDNTMIAAAQVDYDHNRTVAVFLLTRTMQGSQGN